MICKDCSVYTYESHEECKKRNEGKPTPDCDCLHRLDPSKVVKTGEQPAAVVIPQIV